MNLTEGSKNISYLNRDFAGFKQALIDFSKYYFPNTNKDFGPGSVGLMFIEQAAYVGDVLSFYTDNQFQESVMTIASQRKNIINKATSMGYKNRSTTPSQVILDIYQVIPSIDENGIVSPDYSTVQSIKEGLVANDSSGISFITTDVVDFSVNSVFSPMETTPYQRDQDGITQNYILKKQVPAISATKKVKSVSVSAAIPFYKITLEEENVIGIESIYDSDGNRWYEVDHLAQNTVITPIKNNMDNNSYTYPDRTNVPYLLKYTRTSNKFILSIDENNITTITFGSGTDDFFDEEVIPSPDTVGSYSKLNYINSNNLMRNEKYGKAPRNTTLTVTYLVGGGIESNVQSNAIVNISYIEYEGSLSEMTPDELRTAQYIRASSRVNNPSPAVGGDGPESDETIRQNSILSLSSQNRAVTSEDYRLRVYNMPKKFGSIPKVEVSKSSDKNSADINIYVLSYDANKNLVNPNATLVSNLSTYLDQFRSLTDKVNILNGYVINIGVNYKISVQKGYSKKEVLSNVSTKIKEFFNVDKMQFSQPINISQLELDMSKVDGVQSIASVAVTNLTAQHGNYSKNSYDIQNSTQDNIIYPSLDPSVFEIKFPSKDIKGICI